MKSFIILGLALLLGVVITTTVAGQSANQQDRREQEQRERMQRQRAQRGQEKRGQRPRRQRPGESSSLKVADMAPSFKLKSLDGKTETDLTTFAGKKPVVLFFGSYT